MPNTSAPLLAIGDSGSGKSTLQATYADWVWKKFKVKSRLYSFDLAGWSAEMQGLIDVGIVEAWKVFSRDPDGFGMLISETILRASQGWWPEEVDPQSGMSPFAVGLQPPQPGWRGTVLYDGLTSMCAWSMIEMGARAAKGILGGEAGNMKTVESGSVKLSMGNRGSVGFTQAKARDWIMFTSAIQGLVAPPMFTSLELRVVDDETKLPLYGPQLAGKAKSVEALSWFGPKLGCLGPVEVRLAGEPAKQEWRLYLKDYNWPETDPTPHKCDGRVGAASLAALPKYLTDGPGNGSLEKFNIGYFMELAEAAVEASRRGYAERHQDAPGIGKSTVRGTTTASGVAGGVVSAPAAGAGTGGGAAVVSAPVGGPTPGPRLVGRAAAARAAVIQAQPAAQAPGPQVQVATTPPRAPTEEEMRKVEAELQAQPVVSATAPAGAAPPPPVVAAAGSRPAPAGARPAARAPIAVGPAPTIKKE